METLIYQTAELLADAFLRLMLPARRMVWHFYRNGETVRVSLDIVKDEPMIAGAVEYKIGNPG